MKIKYGYLYGVNVTKKILPKNKGNSISYLDSIVIHFTGADSIRQTVNHFSRSDVSASSHLLIGRTSKKIYQFVSFNNVAWHAGVSHHHGRWGMNDYSIGIEIVNPGKLIKREDGKFESRWGKIYCPSEVVSDVHRNETRPSYWLKYTPWQIKTVIEVSRILMENYGINYILGHDEVSPNRKIDPGPLFPMSKVRGDLIGRQNGLERFEATVEASNLNIRKGPGSDFDVAGDPLRKGENVNIIRNKGNWSKISYETEGWVYNKYLKINK